MALVPVYLPQLRLLCLEKCGNVPDSYITETLAAVPELVIINCEGETVVGLRNKQQEPVCSKMAAIPDWLTIIKLAYNIREMYIEVHRVGTPQFIRVRRYMDAPTLRKKF
jgi:hypothetical protein